MSNIAICCIRINCWKRSLTFRTQTILASSRIFRSMRLLEFLSNSFSQRMIVRRNKTMRPTDCIFHTEAFRRPTKEGTLEQINCIPTRFSIQMRWFNISSRRSPDKRFVFQSVQQSMTNKKWIYSRNLCGVSSDGKEMFFKWSCLFDHENR